MSARDEAARGLVAAAVVAEVREVLTSASLLAEVSVRQPQGPVFRGGRAAHPAGAVVVIDLSLGDAALLAQMVRAASDG